MSLLKEYEDHALDLRSLSEVPANEVVSASTIAMGLGVKTSSRARSGCRGVLHVADWTVHLSRHRDPDVRNVTLAHELEHLALVLNDVPAPHDEHLVSLAALSMLWPKPLARARVARVGWSDPAALARSFPGLPSRWAILRAAWVSNRAVVVLAEGERLVWAPGDMAPLSEPRAWEARVARAVRSGTRKDATLFGVRGYPLGPVGADGVVILLPENLGVLADW